MTVPERLSSLETEMKYQSKGISDTQGDVKDLKATIQNLPDQIVTKFDERYALREHTESQLSVIRETIEPLTNLRRHIFTAIVIIILILSAAFVATYKLLTTQGH